MHLGNYLILWCFHWPRTHSITIVERSQMRSIWQDPAPDAVAVSVVSRCPASCRRRPSWSLPSRPHWSPVCSPASGRASATAWPPRRRACRTSLADRGPRRPSAPVSPNAHATAADPASPAAREPDTLNCNRACVCVRVRACLCFFLLDTLHVGGHTFWGSSMTIRKTYLFFKSPRTSCFCGFRVHTRR